MTVRLQPVPCLGIVGSVLVLAGFLQVASAFGLDIVAYFVFEGPLLMSAAACSALCISMLLFWGLSSARRWAVLVIILAAYSLFVLGDPDIVTILIGFEVSVAGAVLIIASMALTVAGFRPVLAVGGGDTQ